MDVTQNTLAPELAVARTEPLTPLAFLGRAAAVFGDREAVVYGDMRWSYAELAAHVQSLARALTARIEPGQTVAAILPNVPAMLAAHYAVPLAGGVLTALNPRLTPRELEYILEHAEARVVLADGDVAAEVRGVVEQIGTGAAVAEVVDAAAGHAAPDAGLLTYDALLAEGAEGEDLPWAVADETAPITLNYTSGTTGRPKGVRYTHRSAHQTAVANVITQGYDGATRYLWTLPMFHCNGWTRPWAVTAAAGTHVCLRAVRMDPIWDALDDEGVTHLCGAPIVAAMIIESERAHPVDREIRMAAAGAAPPPSVIAALEGLNITPVHVYGLTETHGPFTICEPQPGWAELDRAARAQVMARQGVAMPLVGEVAVVDMDMVSVPADGTSMGEVVMRGEGVMLGYFKNPEATEEAFRGGWFHTGDLGVMHPDGYVQLRDRAKDIIISGGENISSIEVEGVIAAHPAVTDVAVVAVADERWGERPVAYVVYRSGAERPDEDALRAHCRERLAGFKVPDRFLPVEEMPRTATGKIRKNELREG
ncbi:AMP-binding protein [Micrococcus porci]|uniref:AMP-binding protein n=1 Tax=Micrococcus porci TaxID=2856555 RepID=UPI003CF46552